MSSSTSNGGQPSSSPSVASFGGDAPVGVDELFAALSGDEDEGKEEAASVPPSAPAAPRAKRRSLLDDEAEEGDEEELDDEEEELEDEDLGEIDDEELADEGSAAADQSSRLPDSQPHALTQQQLQQQEQEELEEEALTRHFISSAVDPGEYGVGSGAICFRLPNFLAIQVHPFAEETYMAEQDLGLITSRGVSSAASAAADASQVSVTSVIRWRYARDPQGRPLKLPDGRYKVPPYLSLQLLSID